MLLVSSLAHGTERELKHTVNFPLITLQKSIRKALISTVTLSSLPRACSRSPPHRPCPWVDFTSSHRQRMEAGLECSVSDSLLLSRDE